MKAVFLACLICATAHAQTVYRNYFCTNDGTQTVPTFTIEVPSNTLFNVVSVKTQPAYLEFSSDYHNSNTVQKVISGAGVILSEATKVLGSATVTVQDNCNWSTNDVDCLLARFETVNQTPLPFAAVQSPGAAVAVVMQSSTNLSTWENLSTNASASGDNYRFFRLKIQ